MKLHAALGLDRQLNLDRKNIQDEFATANGENENLFFRFWHQLRKKVKVNSDYVIKQLRQTKAQRVSVRVQRREMGGSDIN